MKLKVRYAFITLLVLLVCSALPLCAQTGVIKGKVKLQDSKTHDGVLIRTTKISGSGTRATIKPDKTSAAAGEQVVKTDGKGEFEIAGLATGEYVLSFEKQGYKGFTTRRLEVISGETVRLRSAIEMAKEGDPYAVIRGAVLYAGGFTLPNALVTIERIDGGKKFKEEKMSQEGGEFSFRLRADKATYRITASARGFQSASQEITIESDEVRNIAVTLQQIK
jgi:hypothetical protein